MDEVIVWIIIAIAVAYTVKSVVASLGKKGSNGCSGCAGCGECSLKGDCTPEHLGSTGFETSLSKTSVQTREENKNTVK